MNLEHNGYSSTYILPVLCASTLLLVLGCMINPTIYSSDKGYALEGDNTDGDERVDNLAGGEVEEELEEVSEEVEASEANIANSVTATTAGENTRAATTSIAIDWDLRDPDEQETYGNSGEVLYRYNRFTLSATKIKQYQILVNAASGSSNKLVGYLDADHTMPLGVEISGISNADGVTGSNIPSNQWGYALTAGDVTSVGGLAGLTYKAVPNASDSTIALTGTEETLNSKQFTVAFGANVGNENPSGHYTAYVMVSAVMEPKALTIDDIVYMQDMTPEICQTAALEQQYTLTDSRDGNTYTVARIKNQTDEESNCWMTQNLDLINKTVDSTDSDITSADVFVVPVSLKAFTDANRDTPVAYHDDVYGGYYNWYTATAGTGTSSITSGTAAGSICPKAWHLPDTNQLTALLKNLKAGVATGFPYNLQKGGWADGSSIQDVNRTGYYGSSTAAGLPACRFLTVSDSGISPSAFGSSRKTGMSVRCVAK